MGDKATFCPVVRKISDSRNEVVENDQHVLVFPCETGSLCQYVLKSYFEVGMLKLAGSALNDLDAFGVTFCDSNSSMPLSIEF